MISEIGETMLEGLQAFERYQQSVRDGSGQALAEQLIHDVLPLEPGLTERLEQGIEVLNAACGRGRAINLLARHFPVSRFMGYEFDEAAIAAARTEAADFGQRNVRFVRKDPSWFLDTEAYDLALVFDPLEQIDPEGLLANTGRALRPGGTVIVSSADAWPTQVKWRLEGAGFVKIGMHRLPTYGDNTVIIGRRPSCMPG